MQEKLFQTKKCPSCKGTGKELTYLFGDKIKMNCHLCGGKGKVY